MLPHILFDFISYNFIEKGVILIMESFRLNETDINLLNKFMSENNITNKTEAIRQCIRKSVGQQDLNNFMFDINNKMNKLVHNQFLTKKLLEQFFANMGFKKNIDVESSDILEEFNDRFNKYGNNFLG